MNNATKKVDTFVKANESAIKRTVTNTIVNTAKKAFNNAVKATLMLNVPLVAVARLAIKNANQVLNTVKTIKANIDQDIVDSDSKRISEKYMDALEKLLNKPGEVLNDVPPMNGRW